MNIPWADDHLFQIEALSAFQRSGRQQEGSNSSSNCRISEKLCQNLKKKYDEYEEQDLINFNNNARKFGFNDKERRLFRESIRWSTANKSGPYYPLVG